MDVTDRELFDAIVQGDTKNSFVVERVELMLKWEKKKERKKKINILNSRFSSPLSEYRDEGLFSQNDCLRYLGRKFRIIFNLQDHGWVKFQER